MPATLAPKVVSPTAIERVSERMGLEGVLELGSYDSMPCATLDPGGGKMRRPAG